MLTLAARYRMMMPGIFQPTQKERKTSAAVSETNPKRFGQAIEGPAQNERDHRKLSLRRHADSPRHHVLWHPLRPQHVPGMDEHSRTFIRAVIQKSYDSSIVQLLA